MAGLSSPGIGSGLDIGSIVAQLVAAERVPMENRLNRREASYQAELTAYGSLKSAISLFKDSLAKLTDYSDFQKLKVTASDRAIVSATATDRAAAGNYSIEVTDLAKAQSLASTAFADTSSVVGSGTLTFQFGRYDSGSNTFSANADEAIRTVDISTAENSLVGIRDAVNNADIGVSASIINDGSGNRLVFESDKSGADYSLKVSVNDASDASNSDAAGLSQLAYDPTATAGSGKNMSETVTAQDALFSVNGLPVSSSSNSVSSVIEGVTLELHAATSGAPVTISLATNTSAISSNVEGFVSAYNDLMNGLKNLTSYNAETGEAAVLQGDAVTRGLGNQVRYLLSSAVEGLGGGYRSLADIGITTQAGGTLSLDKVKFDAVMKDDYTAIGRLFSASGRLDDPLINFLGASEESQVGDYDINISQLATQGSYSGAATAGFPLTVDANNDTFTIKVDGAESGTITLTQKSYASADELAVELQSRINGDSVLRGGGIEVAVNYVTDHFEITSKRYGSASSVELLAVDTNTAATLGLSVGAGSSGVDVAGTINGLAASGDGRILSGSGDSDGLRLEVLGGATGSRGALSFSRGIADQLDTLLEGYLGSDSLISARTNGLNQSIEAITEQRERLGRRLEMLEARYLKQFTALDAMLGQLQSTSSYLAQQLASLPGAGSKK